ncbi:MAG: PIN domain-containing protein [Thermoguttaceae bacterium]|nr:PIN domain-containing protein [Thermoguttaceae bacterium]
MRRENEVYFGRNTLFREISGIARDYLQGISVLFVSFRQSGKNRRFFEFSKAYGVDFVPLSPEIIKLAIRFTGGYYKFNAADYLQLAVAAHTGCDLFLTNDKKLERFKRLRCVTIED